MSIDYAKDLARIADQERILVFPRFDESTAWELGCALRDAALAHDVAVTIDIRRGDQILFFHAMPGTNPSNADWARRKRNVVELLHRSSYAVGLEYTSKQGSIEASLGVPTRDYATHGGCFPIRVAGCGPIGTVTVSGLPQREDHELVVEVLARMLDRDPANLALD
jgi:uncharacterized protein (UPF0303 family)